ncbi:MAG: 2-phosphosulfolactate phosphatase [Desulfobacterales bacterium]|nr:2-phosphosulfolactate phosphatase [Desulfobacterales bacterium]
MKIIRKSCAEGAEKVQGLVVVIDVFRAFSCAPLFFHFGARRVILEADPEKAFELARENPGFILVGEVDEVPLEGSEVGNSPSHIILKGEPYFRDKTVIHRTTSGVTGVSSAYDRAEEIILGSFVMAKAVAAYIKSQNPGIVTLLAMGARAQKKAVEDEACADYLEHLLTGTPYDPVKVFKDIVFEKTAQRFLQGNTEYLPKEDPAFCLQADLFDFVLTVKRVENQLEVFKKPSVGGGG